MSSHLDQWTSHISLSVEEGNLFVGFADKGSDIMLKFNIGCISCKGL
jgi:hypothetical protein